MKPRTYRINTTERPNADDYRNRAERAEQELAEVKAKGDALVGQSRAPTRTDAFKSPMLASTKQICPAMSSVSPAL